MIDFHKKISKLFESNSNYLELAQQYENGDKNVEKELLKMVEDFARKNRYDRKVYHGTENGEFTVFDPQKTSKKTGFVYVSTGKGTAASYSGSKRDIHAGDSGKGILTLFTKSPETVYDFEESGWDGMRPDGTRNEWHDFGGVDGIAKEAKRMRIQSFEIQNVLDEGPNGNTAWYDSTIAISRPEMLKSADPITYDDKNQIIPLEDRFNSSSPDIRF